MANTLNVGIIGAGNILAQYVKGCRAFPVLNLIGVADIDIERTKARAEEYNLRAFSVDEMLASPEIDIIINLTIPAAHAEVSLAAIEAGKHVHTEKPFAITREEGRKVLESARAKGVRVGCAPDTFLGGGLQTCRKLIEDDVIGAPIAATAFMASRGPEHWHPNPDFFYKVGGGPMFDMGPYYLTALVHLLGPVQRVTASARISFPQRTRTSHGRPINVEVPTHVAGVLDTASGAVATLITSFDVWSHNLPCIEIYGSKGSLSVPDPNTFGGPVLVRIGEEQAWREVPLTHSADVGRGIGVADLAMGVLHNRPHRASGDLGYHVLDLMHSFEDASRTGTHIIPETRVDQPAPLPIGLAPGELDA